MKHFLLILIPFLYLSCSDELNTKNEPRKDYLSTWFERNEDSLHKEFIDYVNENDLCVESDTTSWGEKAYLKRDSTSFMGRFSLEAQKYCDSIQVTYFYNRFSIPRTRIQLSPQYNTMCAGVLDYIFTNLSLSKHFAVEKYIQPDTLSDILGFRNGEVSIHEIRIKTTFSDTLQDLTIYIKKANEKLLVEVQEQLPEILFGEELLLKKVGKVNMASYNNLPDSLLTVQQARNLLYKTIQLTTSGFKAKAEVHKLNIIPLMTKRTEVKY